MVRESFESPLFLVEWAKGEAVEFDKSAHAYMVSNPYDLLTEFNPDTAHHEIKIKVTKAPPHKLRGLASNVIKNTRDALDQAMAAASFRITQKRSKRTHFPFGESAEDLENSLSLRKASPCSGIPEELFPFIRRVKPFPHDTDTALRALARVSGPNKHAVTLLPGVSSDAFILNSISFGSGGGSFHPPAWDKVKQEIVIASYPKAGEATIDIQLPLFIALDIPGFEHSPARKFLNHSVARVESIVNGLKQETERILRDRA